MVHVNAIYIGVRSFIHGVPLLLLSRCNEPVFSGSGGALEPEGMVGMVGIINGKVGKGGNVGRVGKLGNGNIGVALPKGFGRNMGSLNDGRSVAIIGLEPVCLLSWEWAIDLYPTSDDEWDPICVANGSFVSNNNRDAQHR
ncbi:hypothetical protein CMV_019664 [Castanea mollissima]|uniref:Uncharacterized protein n=1 Tax=Castanea mollissima TaxID=60419 RepID=A0A8J4VED2_9ROSI|nr:hypothetical protein CMV_019664 [Castanea mollissima]